MEAFLSDFEEIRQYWWPYVLALVITITGTIRLYIKGATCPSTARIDGKNVVITGGSGGIALTTAKELAKRGANLILAVRNAEKGKEAIKRIKDVCPEANVLIKMIDLSDFASIREFANQMLLEHDKIDILINNAGICFHPYKQTVDGNELTMSTNYFGPFLLTHLLLPLLIKSDNGRVINLSAMAHSRGKIQLDDLNLEKGFKDISGFSQSKLALTIFTKHMASLLKHTNVTFYAVNPGLVRGTGHLRYSILSKWPTKLTTIPWVWLFMKTPKQGSQTVIFTATEPSLDNVSGCYFSECEIAEPSDFVKDTELSEKLYNKTCEIVGINGEKMIEKVVKIPDNKV